jgi:hypothetical protein
MVLKSDRLYDYFRYFMHVSGFYLFAPYFPQQGQVSAFSLIVPFISPLSFNPCPACPGCPPAFSYTSFSGISEQASYTHCLMAVLNCYDHLD